MLTLILKSLALGIVQGFTEFLPISSTAHLILFNKILKVDLLASISPDFIKSFIILVQLSSILAVIILYWRRLWSKRFIYFKKIIVALIPTGIIGFLAYKLVKNFLQESLGVIALALFLGGVIMFIFERRYQEKRQKLNLKKEDEKNDLEDLSYQQCFIVGLFQALAIIPGLSRSAATIIGGLSLGINRRLIVEFSFFLAIPTMIAASSLDLVKSNLSLNTNEIIFLIIGLLSSFAVAWLSVKFLLRFIKKNNFTIFAWYRIILGLSLFIYIYIL